MKFHVTCIPRNLNDALYSRPSFTPVQINIQGLNIAVFLRVRARSISTETMTSSIDTCENARSRATGESVLITAFITSLLQHSERQDRPSLTPMFTLPYTARARACGCNRRVPPEGDDGDGGDGGGIRVGPRTAAGGVRLVTSLRSRLPSFLVYDGRNDVTPPRAYRCVCKQSHQITKSPQYPSDYQ